MDKRKLMLLLGALVVAIGTALAARSMLGGGATPQAAAAQQVAQGPKVLVAQRALPVGTIITQDSISYQAWPKDMVKDAYFIEGEADVNKLIGTVVRFPVTAGQPVTQGALVRPGDRGFLAAALGPGMRAVTISVSGRSGVAGFVFPGDHVDLMLTQTVNSTGEGAMPLNVAETIIRNLRVLATDQQTESKVVDGKTVVSTFGLVTIEVNPKLAEKIAVADKLGQLSLSLRSIADNQSELEKAVASGQVKLPAGASKAEEDRILSQAMNRPVDTGTTFQTGGDVSRFQRRAMGRPADSAKSFGQAMGNALGSMVKAVAAAAPGGGGLGGLPVQTGPSVRVTRGKVTTVEQAGR